MKIKRVFTVMVMVLVFIVVLAACGEKQNNQSTGSNLRSAEPDIKGTITSMEGNRLLIVDKETAIPGNTTPTPIWVKFNKEQLEGVKIGYLVKAWSTGVMLESYPMQTEGIRLEVVNSNVGKGDLQGTVTNVYLDDSDELKSYMEVDGKKLSLIPSTDYLLNDALSDAKQIKVGDRVEIWFPGYQIMDEQVVTQVRIVR
ncbi:DUF3221 domain-containing protein [Cohnella sp.]|uniref:DUF3221 domain-containing protein n=1 Tax=Cohnella sp. TaxID=1883426 RepID=UPI003564E8AE